jgi:hypothetical protein
MTNIMIEEVLVNESEGYLIDNTGVYESFTDSRKILFKSLQREYGRCVSKVYADDKPIGWVFEKTARYEDTGEPFTMSAWAILHARTPGLRQ